MKIKAYFWGNRETDCNGKQLWNHEENGKKYIKYGEVLHELTESCFVCEKSDGVFYKVDNQEFRFIYDIDSFENGFYTRKVNGVLAYDPILVGVDELGNRIVYKSQDGKSRFIIRGDFVEKLNDDSIVCKNVLGTLYQIPRNHFLESYIYKGE